MPELLGAALATPGLLWLVLAGFAAGIVRGFSGFGTAMVYTPVAAQFLDPFSVLITLTLMDVLGPLPNVPGAIKVAHRGDIARLCAGLVVAMPLGLLVLSVTEPDVFRYAVSIIALILLALLITGWRYAGPLRRRTIVGTGMLGGFLGGSTGLAGPPVIMLYMASRHRAKVVRANLMLYLLAVDLAMLGLLAIAGRLEQGAVVLGLLLVLPYLLGNVIGGAIFRPEWERGYRIVAYAIIAASALSGLPFLD